MDEHEKDLIRVAKHQGFLFVNGASQHLIFSYKTEMMKIGKPAICLVRHERHTEIAVLLHGSALIESAKIQIAAKLVFAMSPFSTAQVNDRRIICTRLTFDEGFQLAMWFARELINPANVVTGEFSEHHHDRIEVMKRGDGSLRILRGALYFCRAQRQAA
jgi:hypothetical protein